MRLWMGAGSLPEIWELEAQIADQTAANAQQEHTNSQLEAELKELSDDNAAIEAHARDELGMIKKKESFFQVILREDEEEQPILIQPDQAKDTPHVE